MFKRGVITFSLLFEFSIFGYAQPRLVSYHISSLGSIKVPAIGFSDNSMLIASAGQSSPIGQQKVDTGTIVIAGAIATYSSEEDLLRRLSFIVNSSQLVITACETSQLIVFASESINVSPSIQVIDQAGQTVPITFINAVDNLFGYTVGPVADTNVTGYCIITVTETSLCSCRTIVQVETRVLYLQIDTFIVKVNPAIPGRILPGFETTRIGFELTRPAMVTITDTVTGSILQAHTFYTSGVHFFSWNGSGHTNEMVGIQFSATASCGILTSKNSTQVFVDGPGGGLPFPVISNFSITDSVIFPDTRIVLTYTIDNIKPGIPRTFTTTLRVFDYKGKLVDTVLFTTDMGAKGGIVNSNVYDAFLLQKDAPYLFQIQSMRTSGPPGNSTTNTLSAVTLFLKNDIIRITDTGSLPVITIFTDSSAVFVVQTAQPSAGAITLRSEGGFLVGNVYKINPSGVTLTTPAIVSFNVSESQLPEKLGIYRMDMDGTYREERTIVDPQTRIAYTRLNEFSHYSLLVPAFVDAKKPQIIRADVVPRIISPNEDGLFDVVTFRFEVLDNLVRTIPSSRIDLFDEKGRKVCWLIGNGSLGYGITEIKWNGEDGFNSKLRSGKYTSILSLEDIAGNYASKELGEIIVDLDPPVSILKFKTSLIENFSNFVTSTTPILIVAEDSLAGVKRIEYAIDSGSLTIGSTFTLSGSDGPHIVRFKAVDAVANAECEHNAELFLDNTPPVVSINIFGPKVITSKAVFISNKSKIALVAEDLGVGVSELVISTDNGQFVPYDSTTITFIENGPHEIVCLASDLLGNVAEIVIKVVVDDLAPMATISVDATDISGTFFIPESLPVLDAQDSGCLDIGVSHTEWAL